MPNNTGDLLAGRYQIQRVLGEYDDRRITFGPTFLGYDNALGVSVVIKRYRLDIHVEESQLGSTTAWREARAKAEDAYRHDRGTLLSLVRTMARPFKSNSVVGIRDFFEADGAGHVVMDYVQGTTLRELADEQGGRLPLEQALELLAPVLDGLVELHGRGLVHGDVTPEHVVVNKRGRVRLIGFELPRPKRATTVTVDLNPYDALSKNHWIYYDPATGQAVDPYREPCATQDVYGFCATLYDCLCGQAPPDAMSRVMGAELVAPHELGAGVSSAYEQVIMRGLELQDEGRFQSMAELRDALDEAATAPPEPRRGTRAERPTAAQRRHLAVSLYVDDNDEAYAVGWDADAQSWSKLRAVGSVPRVEAGSAAFMPLRHALEAEIGPISHGVLVTRPREYEERVLLMRNLELAGVAIQRVVSQVEAVAFEFGSTRDALDEVLLCAIHVGGEHVQVGFFEVDAEAVTTLSLRARKVGDASECERVLRRMVNEGRRFVASDSSGARQRRAACVSADENDYARMAVSALTPFARPESVTLGNRSDVTHAAMRLSWHMMGEHSSRMLLCALWHEVHVRCGDLRTRVLDHDVNTPTSVDVAIEREKSRSLYVEFTSPYDERLFRSLKIPLEQEDAMYDARNLELCVTIESSGDVSLDVAAAGSAKPYHYELARLVGTRKAMDVPEGIMEIISALDETERALRMLDQTQRATPAGRGLMQLQRTMSAGLGTLGVQRYSAVGMPFDPHLHEAESSVANPNDEPLVVTSVIRHGYRYRGAVIRRSFVKVAPQGQATR